MAEYRPKGSGGALYRPKDTIGGGEPGGGGAGGGGASKWYSKRLEDMPIRNIPKASTGHNPGYAGTTSGGLKGDYSSPAMEPSGLMRWGDRPGVSHEGKIVQSNTGTGRTVGKDFAGNQARVHKGRRKVLKDFLNERQAHRDRLASRKPKGGGGGGGL